jgi:hypothetical protein
MPVLWYPVHHQKAGHIPVPSLPTALYGEEKISVTTPVFSFSLKIFFHKKIICKENIKQKI